MTNVMNHVGLCVTDLERSRRFYEGLGFIHDRDIHPPDEMTSPLLEIEPPVGVTASYLTMGSFVLELLHYSRPENPSARPRPLNEPGLTHLSLTVDDMTELLGRIEGLGGQVLESTNIGAAVLVRDPDGQILEFLPARADG